MCLANWGLLPGAQVLEAKESFFIEKQLGAAARQNSI
jgi:hypothetical protein